VFLYLIHDSKAAAYIEWVFADTDAVAQRRFSDLVNDPGTVYNAHPEDFSLFRRAECNKQNGEMEKLPLEVVVNAWEVKTHEDAEMWKDPTRPGGPLAGMDLKTMLQNGEVAKNE